MCVCGLRVKKGLCARFAKNLKSVCAASPGNNGSIQVFTQTVNLGDVHEMFLFSQRFCCHILDTALLKFTDG